MIYLKVSMVLSIISLCLLLLGLLSTGIKPGFIITGVIVGFVGIVMLNIGAFKRVKNN